MKKTIRFRVISSKAMKRIPVGPQKNEIALNSGRTIFLTKLFQYQTYWSLLLGLPDKSMNDEIIEFSMKKARSQTQNVEPFLIEPEYNRYKLDTGIAKLHLLRDGVVDFLPIITCIGTFESVKGLENSFLTIIWFQDEFALPIEDSAKQQLLSVNWENLAATLII